MSVSQQAHDNVVPIVQEITFEDFWTLYPWKVSKKDARRAWDRIPPRDHAKILQAVANWRQVWATPSTRQQFIPHPPMPATFLNAERYEDELPPGFKPVTAHRVSATASSVSTPEAAPASMPEHIRALIARLRK